MLPATVIFAAVRSTLPTIEPVPLTFKSPDNVAVTALVKVNVWLVFTVIAPADRVVLPSVTGATIVTATPVAVSVVIDALPMLAVAPERVNVVAVIDALDEVKEPPTLKDVILCVVPPHVVILPDTLIVA